MKQSKMRKNKSVKDENIINHSLLIPSEAKSKTGFEAETQDGLEAGGKIDFPQEVRRLLMPLLVTLALTILLVLALAASQFWLARQIGRAGAASGSMPAAMVPLTRALPAVILTLLAVILTLPGVILVLLAVGAYRAGAGARRLTQVIARQVASQQERIDILERRRTLLLAALAGTEDAVVATDASGRIMLLNPAAERLTGWHEADALGREVRAVLTLVDVRTGAALPDPAAAVHADALRHDFPLGAVQVARGGMRHPVAGSGTPIRAEDGTPGGVTLVFRDVSERQKRAVELREMAAGRDASQARAEALQRDLSGFQDRLQNAEKARCQKRADALTLAQTESFERSALLGDVSDELRTPLNAVLGYTELLQEEAEDSGRRDLLPDLQKIHGAGELLMSLVNDIRDLARIESGPMELYRETFGVAAMLEEVKAAAAPSLVKNGNTLQVRVEESAEEMDADRVKIKQTLLNLLSAAAGFSPGGAVLLNVSRERDGRGDWITFRLADAGTNLAQPPVEDRTVPDLVEFSPDLSSSPRFGGHGLALVMARRFCQMQGGEFSGSRDPGAGAIFRLRFPFSA